MSGLSSESIHPLFSSADADVSLQSRDGTVFLIHSIVLRMTSGFFRTMFALPQPHADDPPPGTGSFSPRRHSLRLDEDLETVEGLLRMITGIEIPTLDSFESVESVLFAAEKYDMPGPISIIRSLILSPPFLVDPLRVYVLASHFEWESVARIASTLTLKINLQEPNTQTSHTLRRLSARDLMRLLDLHWSRRARFRDALESPEHFNAGNEAMFPCGHPNTDASWPKLKLAMLQEMDRCPAADGIIGSGFLSWPEWHALTNAKCLGCVGGGEGGIVPLRYNAKQTLTTILEVLDSLPNAV